MFLCLQLLDQFAAGLIQIRVDEIEVDPHAKRHGHGQTLLELDTVFAIATSTAGSRLGRTTVSLARFVV